MSDWGFADVSINGKARIVPERVTNVNAVDEDGWTPLMLAAAWNDVKGVKFLIEKGANVNAKNNDGDNDNTALDIALNRAHHKVAKLLKQAMEEKGETK